MYFVFPNKKSLHGIILLLIRVNNGGFTVMLGPAHLCFPFNFHTQRLHLCVLRYIQNDLSRYKIPAGEGIALIDRIVSNRNVWHLVCWCQSASDVWTELLEFITTTQSRDCRKPSTKHVGFQLLVEHTVVWSKFWAWFIFTLGPGENENSRIKNHTVYAKTKPGHRDGIVSGNKSG